MSKDSISQLACNVYLRDFIFPKTMKNISEERIEKARKELVDKGYLVMNNNEYELTSKVKEFVDAI